MEIPQPLPWEQRVNGAAPLPGGYTGYLESLRVICVRVEESNLSFEDLVAYSRGRFEISEVSARHSLAFLRNAGHIRQTDGILSVDERIRHWMQDLNDDIPIAMIHGRVKFIGEMLSELQEPKSADELRRTASRYGLQWRTSAQIQRRRGWLQSSCLIEATANRLRLTESGRNLLGRLEIHTPSSGVENRRKSKKSQKLQQSKLGTSESVSISDADTLADHVLAASTESGDHVRFERLVRDAFKFLGFVAKHLGVSGRTDVLLTAPLGKIDTYRVAVDAKTTASGSLKDHQVDWATLREHREKHDANYSLLIAPNPSGNRLMTRAQEFSVAVLSADQLADLCRRHAGAPLSLMDYRVLFATKGEVDLALIDEPSEQVAALQRLVSVISNELPERTDRFGRVSARDVQLTLDEAAEGVTEQEIQRLLDMLAHPVIGVLHRFADNQKNATHEEYVLATSRESATRKIRLLARSLLDADS